jgi:F420-non-reducing hydrogenase iron-sulfur subunit
VKYLKKLLDEIGIGGDRLEMINLSTPDGPGFARMSEEMTERVRKLGPNPARARVAADAGTRGGGSEEEGTSTSEEVAGHSDRD